jgi:hypothetical protein
MVNLLDSIRNQCPEVDSALVDRHFSCLPASYFERSSAADIARHVRLLAALAQGQRVDLEVRRLAESAYEMVAVGEDHPGTVACITAVLAAYGFDLEDVQVATYHDETGQAGSATLPTPFVIVLRVSGSLPGQSIAELTVALRRRLEAAFARLARGDFRGAQAVAAGVEGHDEAAEPAPPAVAVRREGMILSGDFLLDRKLTVGGTSEIYLARQLSLNRTVAVKVSRYEGAADDDRLARFSQEAIVLGHFDCPHIVQVYAAGTVPDRAGRALAWIAVEYLEGGDLARWLEMLGPPVEFGSRWFRQALKGLHYAHRHGVVHRDLKPHNLLLSSAGNLKLTDFGLLLQVQQLDTGEGTASTIMGTPHYMSPEQARGETLDERSDIFALGSTFYHLLSNRLPFEGTKTAAVLAQIAEESAPRLVDSAPQVARPLAIIIDRMMAYRREDRYQDVEVILAELDGYERRGLVRFADVGSFVPLQPPSAPRVIEGETQAYAPSADGMT